MIADTVTSASNDFKKWIENLAEPFKRESDDRPFGKSPQDFKNRCYTFLVVLCNDKDMDKAARYLDPDCVLVHADNAPVHGAEKFIATWKQSLAKMPRYHKDIQDIIVEMDAELKGGARVWIYSRISGIADNVTDSVDMMHFTEDGLFLDSKDVQRTIGAP